MKYLKLFEAKKYNRNLYYESQIDDILEENWTNISTFRSEIKFDVGDDDGYTYTVFFERGRTDEFYLEETAIDKFIKKLKIEFMKSPEEYAKNFKYDLKCLGNIEHFRETEKYNL